MLNSIRDDTDPCGKPFACFHYELMLSPMLTRNLRSPNSVCTSRANHSSIQVKSLDRIPVCQTVSFAAVTSSNTAPVFRFYWNPFSMYQYVMSLHKKVNVAHTWLPSIGSRWSQFLAVSLQMTRVINLVVGCHYFPPGLQLPSQPLRKLLPIFAAWWTQPRCVWTVCLRLLPDSVSASIWTHALLRCHALNANNKFEL